MTTSPSLLPWAAEHIVARTLVTGTAGRTPAQRDAPRSLSVPRRAR
ncbi:hypothetical protein [Spongiactinospora gelatinilytica]|nr:hypothetical protein [Spongiactinospora gelatinilytica]